jgi:hypothetical protein
MSAIYPVHFILHGLITVIFSEEQGKREHFATAPLVCLFLWTSARRCVTVTVLPTARGRNLSLLRPLFSWLFSRFNI